MDKLAADVTKLIWWMVILKIVLFIPTFGGNLFDSVHDDSAIGTTPVPDDWLGEVAKLERVSQTGSNFISTTLDSNGWLSIAEAKRFIEIEKAEEKAEAERSTKGLAALKTKLRTEAAA